MTEKCALCVNMSECEGMYVCMCVPECVCGSAVAVASSSLHVVYVGLFLDKCVILLGFQGRQTARMTMV